MGMFALSCISLPFILSLYNWDRGSECVLFIIVSFLRILHFAFLQLGFGLLLRVLLISTHGCTGSRREEGEIDYKQREGERGFDE